MAIHGKEFIYNGTPLSSFSDDYILVSFEESDNTAHQRRINESAITNDNYIKHYYGHVAETPLEFDLTITRCQKDAMTRADAQTLSNWLFANSEPKELLIVPNPGENVMYEDVYFIGAFTEMRYEEMHSAITFHFVNISGYAFTKLYTYDIDTAVNSTFTIRNVGSRTGEIIYPEVTVIPAETGTLTIGMNGIDNFSVDMTDQTPFTIRDRSMCLGSGLVYSFDNLHNFNWPYIKDGNNVWVFSGNAHIQIKTRFLITTGF